MRVLVAGVGLTCFRVHAVDQDPTNDNTKNRMTQVIDIISDYKAEEASQAASVQKGYEEGTRSCESTEASLKKDIDNCATNIENAREKAEENAGLKAKLKATLEKRKKDKVSKEAELEEEMNERKESEENFIKGLKNLEELEEACDVVIEFLEGKNAELANEFSATSQDLTQYELVQTRKGMSQDILSALRTIKRSVPQAKFGTESSVDVDALLSVVDNLDREATRRNGEISFEEAFLQTGLAAPGSAPAISTLTELFKTQRDQTKLKKTDKITREKNRRDAHNTAVEALEVHISELHSAIGRLETEHAEAKSALAAHEDTQQKQTTLQMENETALENLRKECEEKTKDFNKFWLNHTKAQAGMKKAMEILEGNAGLLFLQTEEKLSPAEEVQSKRTDFASVILQVVHEIDLEVKSLIKLMKSEKEQYDFCNKRIQNVKSRRQRRAAKIADLKAEEAALAEEIADLEKQMSDAEGSIDTAKGELKANIEQCDVQRKQRDEEIEEQKKMQRTISKAIVVLKEALGGGGQTIIEVVTGLKIKADVGLKNLVESRASEANSCMEFKSEMQNKINTLDEVVVTAGRSITESTGEKNTAETERTETEELPKLNIVDCEAFVAEYPAQEAKNVQDKGDMEQAKTALKTWQHGSVEEG